jgi:Uncharacterized stress protein (general stress protein 26)
VLDGFVRVAHRIVWCTLATVDGRGRPRSRVVHPVWERTSDGLTGWVYTRPASPKIAHLRRTPYVSCSYWDPQQEVAVAECAADVTDDPAVREHVWALATGLPEPLGFDPRIMGVTDVTDPGVVILRLTPWRLATGGAVWRRSTAA